MGTNPEKTTVFFFNWCLPGETEGSRYIQGEKRITKGGPRRYQMGTKWEMMVPPGCEL